MAPSRLRRFVSRPLRQAIGTRTAAPTATRLQARKAGGTPSSTASLMKRYGIPQRVLTAAKAAHARALTGPTLAARAERYEVTRAARTGAGVSAEATRTMTKATAWMTMPV